MSGKSQTIGDFAVSRPFRPSQILSIQENRKRFYFSDSSPTILDYWGCLRFMVFISRENLGRSGNCEIPDRLGFSRHMTPHMTHFMENDRKRQISIFRAQNTSLIMRIICGGQRILRTLCFNSHAFYMQNEHKRFTFEIKVVLIGRSFNDKSASRNLIE